MAARLNSLTSTACFEVSLDGTRALELLFSTLPQSRSPRWLSPAQPAASLSSCSSFSYTSLVSALVSASLPLPSALLFSGRIA